MRLIDADKLKAEWPEPIDWMDKEQVLRHITWFRAVIDNMPTAEKVGKWTRHILKNANVPWGYDCSVCGKWFVIGNDTAESYNYCPNCGADMRGEENEQI